METKTIWLWALALVVLWLAWFIWLRSEGFSIADAILFGALTTVLGLATLLIALNTVRLIGTLL